MNIKNKAVKIALEIFPIVLMIAFIPFINDDYLLTGIFLLIIIISLTIKRESKDILIFIFGFIVMIFFEFIFINGGVETFNRKSLFGIMPLWLPFLWGYAFIVIKRGVKALK